MDCPAPEHGNVDPRSQPSLSCASVNTWDFSERPSQALEVFYFSSWFGLHNAFASAEDRALRGRNLSAACSQIYGRSGRVEQRRPGLAKSLPVSVAKRKIHPVVSCNGQDCRCVITLLCGAHRITVTCPLQLVRSPTLQSDPRFAYPEGYATSPKCGAVGAKVRFS